MGSFNHKCNFSQLPARYGDRIVVLVGVRMTSNVLDADGFAPGNSFTPISVPIRGEYNDYGSIENVDHTPGIETLEQYFGMSIDKIVDCAERITCGCEHQIKDDYKKINEVLQKNFSYAYHKEDKLELSYIMEHEAIFDNLIAMHNNAIKDTYYWRLPHEMIEGLGYSKEVIGEENNYEVIIWTHDTLPKLKETCYTWKIEDFGDYGKTTHTIAKFCKYIGCKVPEQYNKSYYESRFLAGIEYMKKEKTLVETLLGDKSNEYSFLRHAERGLFRCTEHGGISGFLLCSLGSKDEHMDVKYMKEVIEVALLYDALYFMQMTWGNTNYYRQDINYDQHIKFLKNCLSVAEEKKKEHEEYDDEDDEE